MSFDSLGLLDQILSAVKECGYTTPTQIQEKTIPSILRGKDILGGAQTGTGKTASFMLPLLQLVKEQKCGNDRPRLTALILVPTRELAAQVHESINIYGKYLHLRSTVIFGGVNIKAQKIKLRKGVDILVATPGRLLDHVNQKTVDLSSINILVLDEADCMLDMGFIHDIRKILTALPKKRQTMLFSATFSDPIKQLAEAFLVDPETIQVARKNAVADQVEQVIYPVDRKRKQELLLDLITKNNWKQALVFTRTKHSANKLSEQLEKEGIRSAAIHGNKTQAARTKSLSRFKKGDVRVLVATDIAARGLNISQLPHVVNFELPIVASDYIHRIGRTGRAGNEGEAISLLCVDEFGLLRDIERLINRSLPQVVLPGYEIDESIKPEPIRKGRGKRAPSSRNRPFQKKKPSIESGDSKKEKAAPQKRNSSSKHTPNQSKGFFKKAKPVSKKKPAAEKKENQPIHFAPKAKSNQKKKAAPQWKSPFHNTQKKRRKKNKSVAAAALLKGKKIHSKEKRK